MSTFEEALAVLPAESPSIDGAKEAAPTEVTKTEPVPEPVDLFTKKFGALSKKEAEIRKREAALAKWDGIDKKAQSLKDNPDLAFGLLQELGLDYGQLTDSIIKKNIPTPKKSDTDTLKEEIQALKDSLAAEKEAETKKAEEAKKAEDMKLYNQYKTNISEHIEQNKEALELTTHFGSPDLVLETIQAYYDETGKLVDISVACGWVEAHLEKQVAELAKASKVSKLLGPKEPVTKEQDMGIFKESKPAITEPTTLSTSTMVARQAPAPKVSTALPVDRDQRIRAILDKMATT